MKGNIYLALKHFLKYLYNNLECIHSRLPISKSFLPLTKQTKRQFQKSSTSTEAVIHIYVYHHETTNNLACMHKDSDLPRNPPTTKSEFHCLACFSSIGKHFDQTGLMP